LKAYSNFSVASLLPLQRGVALLSAWWLTEFRKLFPAWSEALIKRFSNELVIVSISDSETQVTIEKIAHSSSCVFSRGEFSAAAFFDFIERSGLQRNRIEVGLTINASDIFVREFSIPKTLSHLSDDSLDLELEHKTPFDLSAVWHDYHRINSRNISGSNLVQHYIIKRDILERRLRDLRVSREMIDFLAVDPADLSKRIRLKKQRKPASSLTKITYFVGLPSILIMSVVGAFILIDYKKEALRLTVAASKIRADRVIQAYDALNEKHEAYNKFAQQMDARARFSVLWGMLAHRLSDETFLNEVKYEASNEAAFGQITISGYSEAAAALIGLLKSLGWFDEVNFVAPVTYDASQKRERFVLRARLTENFWVSDNELK